MRRFVIIVLVITGGLLALYVIPRLIPASTFAPSTTPTIVFIPGLDLTPVDYTTILNNLSQEYTIIEYNPTYKNTNNYLHMVNIWTQEIKNLVQDQKVIVIGHSVGGAAAVQFCAIHQQCIAGINMDGSPAEYRKLSVPFLYLQAETGQYCDQECVDGRLLMQQITNDSHTQIIKIDKIKHFNFTDAAINPSPELLKQDYLGSIDGKEGLDIINKELNSFLTSL